MGYRYNINLKSDSNFRVQIIIFDRDFVLWMSNRCPHMFQVWTPFGPFREQCIFLRPHFLQNRSRPHLRSHFDPQHLLRHDLPSQNILQILENIFNI